MRLYKPNITSINIDGEDYPADSQGVIDLPDHLVTSGLFSAGWVDARGHLAQLARAEKAGGLAEIKTAPETKAETPLGPVQDAVDLPTGLPVDEGASKSPTQKTQQRRALTPSN